MVKDSREIIRNTALELFSKSWFEAVPVAKICREAGVSNGLFYRYYNNKVALVRNILDVFLEHFSNELEEVTDLDSFVRVVADASLIHSREVSVFREGQYRFKEYEQRLRELYLKTISRIFKRDFSEAEYLFIVSGLRFLATRALYRGLTFDRAVVVKFIMNGVFTGFQWDGLFPEHNPPHVESSNDTKSRLIDAGINTFGRYGYHSVGISDVVREANLSVGTFYIHFPSKELFLVEIVNLISSRTRRYLRSSVPEGIDRLHQEIEGIKYFLDFFGLHKEYYEIVREAEFIAPKAVNEYYDAFERGYLRNLVHLPENQRQTGANFLMGLSHYLGIEFFFSDRVSNFDSTISEIARLLSHGI